MPSDLLRAIDHANKIIDWHENLPEEDIPPEWMWPFDSELKTWFEQVRNNRNTPTVQDDRTEVPLMENELTKERKKR